MDRAHRLHLPWPPRRSGSRDGIGSIWLRLRARLHHWRLDHEIAAGKELTGPLPRTRAAALIERRRRERLAGRFDSLVDEAARPPPRMSAAAPLYGAQPPLFGTEPLEELGVAARSASAALYLGPSTSDDRSDAR